MARLLKLQFLMYPVRCARILCRKIKRRVVLTAGVLSQACHDIIRFAGDFYVIFFYNELTSCDTVLDCCLQPCFFLIDRFAKYMGPIFMISVMTLIFGVVLIFYVFIFPYYFYQGWLICILRLVVGHWLFINVGFHFFMAVTTDPGYPPQKVWETVSICKKCISPKPPRTHHCTICRRCVLKMDHHCPWINNCVGHFNHRYFFLFCCYISLSTLYICVSCYALFHEHFYGGKELYFPGALYPLNIARDILLHGKNSSLLVDLTQRRIMELQLSMYGLWLRSCVIFEFILCSGVFVAITLLVLWHAQNISRAETSIEGHINKKERVRLKKKGKDFRNPYDFSPLKNWQIFLGLSEGRSFLFHVLLPSPHPPDGDGLSWFQTLSPKTQPSIV